MSNIAISPFNHALKKKPKILAKNDVEGVEQFYIAEKVKMTSRRKV